MYEALSGLSNSGKYYENFEFKSSQKARELMRQPEENNPWELDFAE